MTDKIQQTRRAVFEVALAQKNSHRAESGFDALRPEEVRNMWWAFNDALDCVLIDSPGEFEGADSDGSHAWNACHRSFVDAIKSTNLGIKVK